MTAAPLVANAAPSAGLWATAQALLRELPALLSDRVELLTLELKRAGRALAEIVVLLVVAIILGVTAWLAMWGVVVGGLMAAGLHWAAALLAVLLLNAVVAVWAVARLRKLLPQLGLPATRRHLVPSANPALPTETKAPAVHDLHHASTHPDAGARPTPAT